MIDKLSDAVKNYAGRIGFKMNEIMSGSHSFTKEYSSNHKETDVERPMEFNIDWGPDSVTTWLNPFGGSFMKQPAKGTMTIEGLCDEVPCEGTLELKYIQNQSIKYTLDFEAQGMRLRYIGEKTNIKPWNVHKTHTTCKGKLYDKSTNRVVSESVTYFRLSTALDFVGSFRLTKQ